MQDDVGHFPLSSVLVLTVREDGRVTGLDAFVDPAMYAAFALPAEKPRAAAPRDRVAPRGDGAAEEGSGVA